MATSLTPYAGPVAREAAEDIGLWNQRIRSAGLRNLFLAVVVIFAAAGLKSMGLSIAVWALIIAVEGFTAFTVLPLLLGLTPPAWATTFLTGLAGEANRLPEGLVNANLMTKKLWRFGLWMVCYSSLALWVVALWNIENNFHLILPLIAAGLGITVLVVLLFKEGNFFPWTMYFVKLAILFVMLGMALPGRAGLTVTRWVETAVQATVAHKAEDAATRTANDRLNALSQACYDQTRVAKEIVLPGDLDRCSVDFITGQQQCLRGVKDAAAEKGIAVDQKDINQCLKTGRLEVTATAPQPPVTSTNGGQAVESAKATTVATADCVTAITARYTPGETLMATPLGEKKFCEGTYRAIYSGVRAQLHLPPGKESYTRHMNCQGIDPATGLVVIAAQEFMRKHIPLEPGLPYGLCFLRTFSEDDGPGEVITTAQDAQFSLGKASRIAADINATTQGHAGPGWVEIKIFKL